MSDYSKEYYTEKAQAEVERLARETVDEIESFYCRVNEIIKKAQDVDDDSIGDLQDFAEQVAGFDGPDREPARELRLALVQLDLARASELERLNDPMFGVTDPAIELGAALGDGARRQVDKLTVDALIDALKGSK